MKNQSAIPPQWTQALERLTANESILWAGRPQPPFARWIQYQPPLVPSLSAILGIPLVFVIATTGLSGGPFGPWALRLASPWVMAGLTLLMMAALIFDAHTYFRNLLYVVTDRRILAIDWSKGMHRPVIRSASSMPGLRIAWKSHHDGLSTFKITHDERRNGRTRRVLLVRFYDVAAGRIVKSLLVHHFILRERAMDAPFQSAHTTARVASQIPPAPIGANS